MPGWGRGMLKGVWGNRCAEEENNRAVHILCRLFRNPLLIDKIQFQSCELTVKSWTYGRKPIDSRHLPHSLRRASWFPNALTVTVTCNAVYCFPYNGADGFLVKVFQSTVGKEALQLICDKRHFGAEASNAAEAFPIQFPNT
ncbi:hypothetical protein CEXT_341461 [Caerostris extrusa]|uniref:Uncharacterized protein n=1 Tax=Caerostris extrusa TaxID=172846 RepID=A0AAV4NEP0_CAEEX|nr:hypothetical protein CEXT_341461 [Caerostris extrusa]